MPSKQVGALAPALQSAIDNSMAKFQDSGLSFERESVFAVQQLMNNSYTQKVAMNNPASLQVAMLNVAATGLSLNPVLKQAYLIPRKVGNEARVILDISYQGLVQIASTAGVIHSCTVALVYESEMETFEWRGEYEKPIHKRNPFAKDKGAIMGAYAQTRLPDGTFIFCAMASDAILKRRDCSEMVKRNNGKAAGPWKDWPEEMIIKTVIKHAAKTWPKASVEFNEALRVLNEDNGEGLAPEDRVINSTATVSTSAPVDVNDLPPPPKAESVRERTRQFVEKAVNRAVETGAWSACEEAFETRLKDPLELSFAINSLFNAKAASSEA